MANKKQNRGPGLLLRNAGIFNPVLVQAVGLCPVIAMATTLKGAALLSLVAATAITLCELIASMFLKVIPRWVRTGIYIILGGAIITPFMILIEKLNPELFGSLGIYLPVMAVNSLLVLRCERFAVKLNPMAALRDGFTASVGYAAVLILVGIIREIFGSGSIAGFRFWEGRTLSGLLLPFGGFLMLGFAAATLRMIISVYWPKFLDKKQPKPGTKKPQRTKPVSKLPVPDLPDLTPEEDPFALSEISGDSFPDDTDYNFDLFSKEKSVAPAVGLYGEAVIEEPEIITNTAARKITLNSIAAEIAAEPIEYAEPENYITDSEEIASQESEPEPETAEDTIADVSAEDSTVTDENTEDNYDYDDDSAEKADDNTDFAEETESEPVRTIRLTPASVSFDEVDDDELEMLLNRPVDDIFTKSEEDKK